MKYTRPKFDGTDVKDEWYMCRLKGRSPDPVIIYTHIIGVCRFKTLICRSRIAYKFTDL